MCVRARVRYLNFIANWADDTHYFPFFLKNCQLNLYKSVQVSNIIISSLKSCLITDLFSNLLKSDISSIFNSSLSLFTGHIQHGFILHTTDISFFLDYLTPSLDNSTLLHLTLLGPLSLTHLSPAYNWPLYTIFISSCLTHLIKISPIFNLLSFRHLKLVCWWKFQYFPLYWFRWNSSKYVFHQAFNGSNIKLT